MFSSIQPYITRFTNVRSSVLGKVVEQKTLTESVDMLDVLLQLMDIDDRGGIILIPPKPSRAQTRWPARNFSGTLPPKPRNMDCKKTTVETATGIRNLRAVEKETVGIADGFFAWSFHSASGGCLYNALSFSASTARAHIMAVPKQKAASSS